MGNIEKMFRRSYNELSKIFYEEFPVSEQFKKMVLMLNENMIEYRFMSSAGLFN
jgi:hypothetical protein